MDVMNIKVRHAIWGTGTIVQQAGMYITVDFQTKISKFIYPDAFENFIEAEDLSIQSAIIQEINEAKSAVGVKKQAHATCKAENQKIVEVTPIRSNMSGAIPYRSNPVSQLQRLEGKRMTFFVFQGNTFEKEYQGNYIWAPISNKSGNTFHHWTRLLDIRTGDIILHGCDGYIKAISTARGACYECPQPDELHNEDMWERDGRRVDCNYIRINRPIKTSNFIDSILRLSTVKYSPFDKDGNGNMGYLYELNRELAS